MVYENMMAEGVGHRATRGVAGREVSKRNGNERKGQEVRACYICQGLKTFHDEERYKEAVVEVQARNAKLTLMMPRKSMPRWGRHHL